MKGRWPMNKEVCLPKNITCISLKSAQRRESMSMKALPSWHGRSRKKDRRCPKMYHRSVNLSRSMVFGQRRRKTVSVEAVLNKWSSIYISLYWMLISLLLLQATLKILRLFLLSPFSSISKRTQVEDERSGSARVFFCIPSVQVFLHFFLVSAWQQHLVAVDLSTKIEPSLRLFMTIIKLILIITISVFALCHLALLIVFPLLHYPLGANLEQLFKIFTIVQLFQFYAVGQYFFDKKAVLFLLQLKEIFIFFFVPVFHFQLFLEILIPNRQGFVVLKSSWKLLIDLLFLKLFWF